MSDVMRDLTQAAGRRRPTGTMDRATLLEGTTREPLFRSTSVEDTAFSGYGACPRCTSERHVVAEHHTAGTLRLGLVCNGCDTRILI